VKDLYNPNYKSLKKETEDTRRQKDPPCTCIGRINTVKMAILPKATRMFNAIPIRIPMGFFRGRKSNLKSMWKHKRPWTAKAIQRKKKAMLEVSQYLTSNYTTKL
jgi:hypothetical protein